MNTSSLSPLAGKPAPKGMLVDVARLQREYFERRPDLHDPNQFVSFGTSGQRGTHFQGTFTEAHILAETQAICDYRRSQRTDGPLYLDTHALSSPAQDTAIEVLAANDVDTIIQENDGVTPTPVISYTRIDAPASPEQKNKLQSLSPGAVEEAQLAREPITVKLTRAPGNNAPIGGLKVVTKNGWFAARPSGTEDIYKIYAESFKSEQHLACIVAEAQTIVSNALRLTTGR